MRRKHAPRNGSLTERRKVCCRLLAINQRNAEARQCRDQPSKRNFRSVGFVCEHRLAKKDAVKNDTVETAHKLALPPCLYRMGEARIMQLAVRVDDGRRNPRTRLTGAQRCRAVFNDIAKRSVDS